MDKSLRIKWNDNVNNSVCVYNVYSSVCVQCEQQCVCTMCTNVYSFIKQW